MPFIFEWEGGYDHDPDDPGGETNFGIDKRSHPAEDIKHLTKDRAKEIYFEEWTKYGCEDLPEPLGEVEFNCNVNCGNGRTRKIMEAIAAHPTAAAFEDEQEAFYRRLVAARPASAKYLKGWLNRLNDLRSTQHLG